MDRTYVFVAITLHSSLTCVNMCEMRKKTSIGRQREGMKVRKKEAQRNIKGNNDRETEMNKLYTVYINEDQIRVCYI